MQRQTASLLHDKQLLWNCNASISEKKISVFKSPVKPSEIYRRRNRIMDNSNLEMFKDSSYQFPCYFEKNIKSSRKTDKIFFIFLNLLASVSCHHKFSISTVSWWVGIRCTGFHQKASINLLTLLANVLSLKVNHNKTGKAFQSFSWVCVSR